MAQPPLAILTLPELLAQDSDSQVPACIAPVGSFQLAVVLDARFYGSSLLWAPARFLWSLTLAPDTDARSCGHLLAHYGPRRSLLRTLAPVGT